MALKPKIVISDLSDAADSFKVKDITGAYDGSTNPGGYGSPNTAANQITSILFQLFNEGDEDQILTYKVTSGVSDFTDGITAQPLTAQNFGGSSSSSFTDGVIYLKYNTLKALVNLSSITNDGKTIHSSAAFKGDEDVVVIDNKVYRVDTAASNTTSLLNLFDAVPTDTATVYPGYVGEDTEINVKHLESDLAKSIAALAGKCGCTDEEYFFLMKILMKKVGAEVEYNCGNYSGAQQIITTANNDLSEGGCLC